MKKVACLALVVGLVCIAAAALAGTRKIDETVYSIGTDLGEVVTLPNGSKVRVGMNWRTANVDVSGVEHTGWCTQTAHLDASDQPTSGVGHCVFYQDNGDAVWVALSYKVGQLTMWTVMGGTGQYDGATGGGTSSLISQRGDGTASTFKSQGSIITK